MAVPQLEGDLLGIHEHVRNRWEMSKRVHDAFEPGWNHWFGLYRGHNEYKELLRGAGESDRDEIINERDKLFGKQLHIPKCFEIVETILPRAVSNRPRMNILPDGDAATKNVENMKQLIDRQQERIGYELKLQEVVKDGLVYGLGVQKTGWRKEYVMSRELQRLTVPTEGIEWGQSDPFRKCVFDDPDAMHVSLFDFFWDPIGYDIESCRYLFHRTWKDTPYVLERLADVERGWNNPGLLQAADVAEMGPTTRRSETTTQRERLQGTSASASQGADDLHEIWEYHDRDGKVIVILDGQFPVHVGENPYWHGEFPFQIFRPTTAAIDQIPGIGEIEPLEQLQAEIDVLRAQRRDNAALKLAQVYAFHDGFIDKNDLQWAPGTAIPVNGDPREMLVQFQVGDIPNSSYMEEDALKGDFDRTSGISDPVSGVGDASQTATGVQLVQAAANIRISNKTRRVEIEVCAPATRQWVSMNQQMIIERPLPVQTAPTPLEPEGRWKVIKLTPEELAGNFIVLPTGDSIAPENEAMRQQLGMMLLQSFRADPMIDQRKLYTEVLEHLGFKQPEQWFAPAQYVPPITLDILAEDFQVPPEILMSAVEMAIRFEDAARNGVSPEGDPDMEPEQAPPSGG